MKTWDSHEPTVASGCLKADKPKFREWRFSERRIISFSPSWQLKVSVYTYRCFWRASGFKEAKCPFTYLLCFPAGALTDDLLLQAYHRASRGSTVGCWSTAWKVFLTAKSQNVVLSWDDELLLFVHSRCQVPSQNCNRLHFAVPLATLATCCSRHFAVKVMAIYRLATVSGWILRKTCSWMKLS